MQKKEHDWKLFCEGNFCMCNVIIGIFNMRQHKKTLIKIHFWMSEVLKIAENNFKGTCFC